VDAAPVEAVPVEASTKPEVEPTRESVIVPLEEESVAEPAPVEDLLEGTDNPQGE
jgi:hypothetical protein